MGWLIAAGVLTLMAVMPLGVQVLYDENGFAAKLVIGPFFVTLFPQKGKKKEKKTSVKKTQPKKSGTKTQPVREEKKKGGSFADFQGIIREVLAFLGTFRRKLVVRKLELKLTLAGDDPADLACNFGNAWNAMGNLIPQLERVFTIRKRDIDVSCDFCAEQTVVYGCLDVVISLGRLLCITGLHGLRIFREFMKLKNLRKGGNKV